MKHYLSIFVVGLGVFTSMVAQENQDQTRILQDLVETVQRLQAQHKREVAELRALTTALADELDGVHARLSELATN